MLWEPAPFPTLNPLLWRPIAAGMWRQHEATNGTYDVQDLADMLEFLDIQEENRRRYAEWQEQQRSGDD